MARWRIEQQGDHEFVVRNRATNEHHFTQTAEDAVRLMRALEKDEQ